MCLSLFAGQGNSFPRPEDFAKAIYTFDIGQNDIAAALQRMGQENTEAAISDIVDQLSNQLIVSDSIHHKLSPFFLEQIKFHWHSLRFSQITQNIFIFFTPEQTFSICFKHYPDTGFNLCYTHPLKILKTLHLRIIERVEKERTFSVIRQNFKDCQYNLFYFLKYLCNTLINKLRLNRSFGYYSSFILIENNFLLYFIYFLIELED